MCTSISVTLLVALIVVLLRHEQMEEKYRRVLRDNKAAMTHLKNERRLSAQEPTVPGQGRML